MLRAGARRRRLLLRRVLLFMVMTMVSARVVYGQVTPAAGYTPPDDTPAIRVGMTLFPNYSYQKDPKITDADGNTVNKNSFDVGRAYVNITGQVSHIVAFRVTPDITRE